MSYKAADYTFWGLFNHGEVVGTPIDTLAYLIALTESGQNEILDLQKAKFVLRCLFDLEEQMESAAELMEWQQERLPKGFFPQTPVMLTLRWSPISAVLERGWMPLSLTREERKGMACASGIWDPAALNDLPNAGASETPEELFWSVLKKIVAQAKGRGCMISISAMPGWSYKSNTERPNNFTLAEAERADRVIWQRTPRVR